MYWAIIFVTHQVGVTLFRCTAVVTRNIVLANGAGMLMLLCTILLDGFVIIKRYIHPWVVWYEKGRIVDLLGIFMITHGM